MTEIDQYILLDGQRFGDVTRWGCVVNHDQRCCRFGPISGIRCPALRSPCQGILSGSPAIDLAATRPWRSREPHRSRRRRRSRVRHGSAGRTLWLRERIACHCLGAGKSGILGWRQIAALPLWLMPVVLAQWGPPSWSVSQGILTASALLVAFCYLRPLPRSDADHPMAAEAAADSQPAGSFRDGCRGG